MNSYLCLKYLNSSGVEPLTSRPVAAPGRRRPLCEAALAERLPRQRCEDLLDLRPIPLPSTTRVYVPPPPPVVHVKQTVDIYEVPEEYVPPPPPVVHVKQVSYQDSINVKENGAARTCWTCAPCPCRPPPGCTCRRRRPSFMSNR
ncbi:unnamed protein product [Plutella xylostella]|uniref:(diamondback moth) hypothetical protein n=1 Tax=Plutella xylostella TaxID=51655 RepID=A0A8S4FZT0_PLUXY|nr:unnamed protein product [Plutella xylostella]